MNYFLSRNLKKFLSIAVLCAATAITTQAQQQVVNPNPGMSVREQLMRSPLNKSRQERVQEILNYAASFKGTRYVYGTMGPNSFDCSGFTSYVFKNFGIKLDRSSRGQVANGRHVAKDKVLPGDLVFFGNRGNSRVGHVGIVYEVDDKGFKFIHAATRSGITINHITDTYYQTRYRGACRVID